MGLDLAFVWATIISVAVLAYAMLDGFDLGIGILSPLLNDAEKSTALRSIAPVWDGNETWLVLGGGGLFAVFPLAYAVLMPAFYAPVIAMLIALVFRGVSMEFRGKTQRYRRFWELGFFVGSLIAAAAQGLMLGAFIQGVEVANRSYAGGWFDWLTPFSLLCSLAVIVGYSLLGSGWLVLKTDGLLASQMRVVMRYLAIATLVLIVLVSSSTPLLDARLTERWFTWPNLLVLAPVPLLIAGIGLALLRALKGDSDSAPFLWAQALFAVTFVGFGISSYPYIVPHEITIWEAASPDKSLSFLLVGTVFLLPIILLYTAHSYWVFRGKVGDEEGYGH